MTENETHKRSVEREEKEEPVSGRTWRDVLNGPLIKSEC